MLQFLKKNAINVVRLIEKDFNLRDLGDKAILIFGFMDVQLTYLSRHSMYLYM